MMLQSADWVVFNTHQQLELMRVTCGGWRRPFAFHCTSATNLIFTYHQPRIGTTHVHRRGPARPRLTPTPAQGVLQDPQAAQPAPSTAEGMNHNQTVHSPKESDRAEGVSGQQTSEQGVRTGASEPDGGPAWGSGSRGGGGGEPVTSLHAVHHGREVLCCALLQQVQSQLAPPTDSPSSDSPSSDSPSSDSPSSNSPSSLSSSLPKHATEPGSGKLEGCSMKEASPLCLLTGSEDGSMRQLLYSPPTVSASCSSLKSREAAAEQGRSEGDGNTPDEGQAGSGKKQKRKAGRESDRQQRGLFGGDEVGFQAAGSAVKSIVAMSFGAGIHSTPMHKQCCWLLAVHMYSVSLWFGGSSNSCCNRAFTNILLQLMIWLSETARTGVAVLPLMINHHCTCCRLTRLNHAFWQLSVSLHLSKYKKKLLLPLLETSFRFFFFFKTYSAFKRHPGVFFFKRQLGHSGHSGSKGRFKLT